MIIKIKKRDLNIIVLVSLMLIVFSLIVFPVIIYAGNDIGNRTNYFKVTLDLGNQAPTITWVQTGVTGDPTEAGTTDVKFAFNVTDTDGAGDINDSTAMINVTLLAPSGQSRANTSCVNTLTGGNTKRFNCTVTFYYYDNASANWAINVSIKDNSSEIASNSSETFTYYELSAFSLARASINFSQLTIGSTDQAAEAPLILNNTGNDDFDIVNITAYDLIGVTDSNKLFGVGNMTVNSSNTNGAGTVLANATEINLGSNTKLWHGEGAAGNLTLYFWADVPSGIIKQVYNTTTLWQVDVDDSSD